MLPERYKEPGHTQEERGLSLSSSVRSALDTALWTLPEVQLRHSSAQTWTLTFLLVLPTPKLSAGLSGPPFSNLPFSFALAGPSDASVLALPVSPWVDF